MTLFKHTGILAAEELATDELLKAFETSRKRHLIYSSDEDLVTANDGAQLSAVCQSARLCWAHYLCQELADHFDYDASDRTINQPVFLFTLVDISCARSSDELDVDLRPMIRHLRKGLRNRDYIGVIEPGLYSHVSAPGANLKQSKCISWHLHALVSGMTRKQAKHLVAELNSSGKYTPITPGQVGAHQCQVRKRELAGAIAYLLKPPKTAYRLGLRSESAVSAEPSHIQYRSELRPGERVSLYLQLRHLSLPDVWIAGGQGRRILGRVKRSCWAAIRRHERTERERPKSRSLRPADLFPQSCK
ncbi:hypothetical protein [Bradyrhizobium jicamae]|uniref:hypothetical protein n=1 Tax=Bradyrhizobium jicamae TaxID=280332 RepID=UPI001BA926F5|nr:hypothetical protein [Bradyrhizobium jicamae]MBR0939246.1 hypothetical protein [Bradyrhizobium jicamae]